MRQQRELEFCYPKVQTAGMWVLLSWLHDNSLLVFVIGAHPLSRSILAKSNLIDEISAGMTPHHDRFRSTRFLHSD